MSPRSKWGSLLAGVPKSEPPQPDNIVHLPRPSLDDMEDELARLEKAVIDRGVSVDLSVRAYNSALDEYKQAQARMIERLKESGFRVESAKQFPEIDA